MLAYDSNLKPHTDMLFVMRGYKPPYPLCVSLYSDLFTINTYYDQTPISGRSEYIIARMCMKL